jgi:hypothetical protein
MPCRELKTFEGKSGFGANDASGYATEADCLNACNEGACCEGTTCSIKPQCQCQGAGQVFKGVGTACSPNPCLACVDALRLLPKAFTVTISNLTDPNLADFSGTHVVTQFFQDSVRALYIKNIGFLRQLYASVTCGDDFQYQVSVSTAQFNGIRLSGSGALVSRATSDGCYQESFGLSGDAGSGNASVECNPLP